ncbi:MAG: hypothetical protein ACI9MR_004852 [Myxococcota bacterium]|jgi:hypothetical protein
MVAYFRSLVTRLQTLFVTDLEDIELRFDDAEIQEELSYGRGKRSQGTGSALRADGER